MLPPIDALMEEFSVARITVRQAIGLLREEGLVSPERGRGTLVHKLPEEHRQLRVHTTLSGLVEMYRYDLPVLTNLEETQTSPDLLDGDGKSAGHYVHMRRVHARDQSRYCVISLYIAESIFLKAADAFRTKAALPVLCELPGIEVGRARQTMRIAKADAEIASLLGLPVGDPTAEVRRVLCAPDDTVIYVADVIYRGDYIHLDMDLKP